MTIVGNDDMAAPGISVGVADVDDVHAKAVAQGFEIVYPLRDEGWELVHCARQRGEVVVVVL